MTVRVTFRNYDETLTCLMTEKFKSVAAAKAAIKCDAMAFLDAHNHVNKHDAYCGLRRRAYAKWMDTKNTDYYRASAKDGSVCYYQYFVEK